MKGSWRLGEVVGIGVFVHWTFLILIAAIVAAHWTLGARGSTLAELAFTFAIFGCVLLHELGHSLIAKRYGIETTDITLLPIGGVARLQRLPRDPQQELWIALAG